MWKTIFKACLIKYNNSLREHKPRVLWTQSSYKPLLLEVESSSTWRAEIYKKSRLKKKKKKKSRLRVPTTLSTGWFWVGDQINNKIMWVFLRQPLGTVWVEEPETRVSTTNTLGIERSREWRYDESSSSANGLKRNDGRKLARGNGSPLWIIG